MWEIIKSKAFSRKLWITLLLICLPLLAAAWGLIAWPEAIDRTTTIGKWFLVAQGGVDAAGPIAKAVAGKLAQKE